MFNFYSSAFLFILLFQFKFLSKNFSFDYATTSLGLCCCGVCGGKRGIHCGYFGLLLLLLSRESETATTHHTCTHTCTNTHTQQTHENFAAFCLRNKKVNGKSWKLHTALNWEWVVGRLTWLIYAGFRRVQSRFRVDYTYVLFHRISISNICGHPHIARLPIARLLDCSIAVALLTSSGRHNYTNCNCNCNCNWIRLVALYTNTRHSHTDTHVHRRHLSHALVIENHNQRLIVRVWETASERESERARRPTTKTTHTTLTTFAKGLKRLAAQ